jgi:hypothetical protein
LLKSRTFSPDEQPALQRNPARHTGTPL